MQKNKVGYIYISYFALLTVKYCLHITTKLLTKTKGTNHKSQVNRDFPGQNISGDDVMRIKKTGTGVLVALTELAQGWKQYQLCECSSKGL